MFCFSKMPMSNKTRLLIVNSGLAAIMTIAAILLFFHVHNTTVRVLAGCVLLACAGVAFLPIAMMHDKTRKLLNRAGISTPSSTAQILQQQELQKEQELWRQQSNSFSDDSSPFN